MPTRPPELVSRWLLLAALAALAIGGAMLARPVPARAATAPTISAVSPALGPSAGGTLLTITGTGFASGAAVSVGGAAATGVAVVSATQITATTPAGAPGAAIVSVTNPDTQTATFSGGFTYQFPAPTTTLIAPASGTSAGGTAVTITGTGFLAGAGVTVGGVAATSVVVVDATTITAVTPAHPIGAENVTVTNTDGQAATLVAAFTYTAAAAPTVTGVAPASGSVAGGSVVTISGTGFVAGAVVTFGGTAATAATVTNATTISATTPAFATAGAVAVAVTNPDTQGGTLAGGYTYIPLPAPTITTVAPTSGVAAGGTPVTITGTNFRAGATVAFGGSVAANVVVASATSITTTTPLRTSAGAVNVVVTNPDTQSATRADGFTYTPNAAPTLTTVAPSSGPIAGGTVVTLTGSGFIAGATVRFGGVIASGVTVLSATSITATTAAGTAGAAVVAVTNVDGQIATKAGGYTYNPAPVPTITAVAPTSGPTAGGTTITITGTNFVGGATVTVGGAAATVLSTSATTITASTAAHAVGAETVVVRNPDAQEASLASGFTFQTPAPSVSGVSPASGPQTGGTTVTLAGSGFLAGATVTFGEVPATDVVVVSGTAITATAPARPAAGAVDVRVANPGSAPALLAAAYTYAAAGTPNVAASPPSGGLVMLVSGTTDLAALIASQKFSVAVVSLFDPTKQAWQVFIVGAPVPVNTLKALRATDIVILRRK